MKTSNGVRVLTADDHMIVRTGLQLMLHQTFSVQKIYEAHSCETVLSALREHKPTHLISGMSFRDGNAIEVLPAVKKLYPALRIMVYSRLPEEVYAPALRRHGINTYVSKESTKDHLTLKLQHFIHGTYERGTIAKEIRAENPFSRLSTRELEVLHYLLIGKTTGAISTALLLHKTTVSTLKSRIFEKTGVKDIGALIDIAAAHHYNP